MIQPKFIAIDGITAGRGMMLTPSPFHLGAILMGINSCAVDTVGCHMVHIDPAELVHLRYASSRGFGPMTLSEIDVSGDFPLDEVRSRTENIFISKKRVDHDFVDNDNLRCTVGTFPEEHSKDYCWGGCPGALQEAAHIIKANTPEEYAAMRKIHYVVGNVQAPLTLKEGEKVIFAGDCTRWSGELDGKRCEIVRSYVSPCDVDENKTRSNDMLLKTVKAILRCLRVGKKPYPPRRGMPGLGGRPCPLSLVPGQGHQSQL